ncbi:guanylate kinase [Schizosaccharomyces japonicus yFS275]|uniref:Guanylate kinase n=1 Tax=Schizosaccharomyces japonicus (strain yFS275 / FY16936) TaxID=402676 RepID=B6K7X5_SCHJY|nr:guanylate kinase [Schizosaccharomyces japonicus yFS275]EEB09629.1 guanylate kinase [Schizosaccharomyces japonicus yFS275]
MASLRRPIILFGPSGVGKSTLVKRLMQNYKDRFGFSVSHTTRQPRPGERNGVEYYFVTKEEFQKLVSENKFVEWAVFSGNMYGTSVMAIDDVIQHQKTPLLDIDMQGVMQVKKSELNARYLFIAPPSVECLEQRLRGRGTESEESISKRLAQAIAEIEYSKQPGNFDGIVVNDNLDTAYKQLEQFCLKDE